MASTNKSHSWLKWVIILAVLLVAVVTKPDKAKHSEKIQGYLMEQTAKDDNTFSNLLTAMLGPYVIDRFLIVDDYFLFNIGRIRYEDTDKALTLGIFNTVIPLPQ